MLRVYPYGLQLPAGRRWQGLVTALTEEGAGQLRQRNDGSHRGKVGCRKEAGYGFGGYSMTGACVTASGQGWS